MIAMAVMLCLLVLAVGNLMGAKPSATELWLDKVRMMARMVHLNPKLIPYPDWLPIKKAITSTNPDAAPRMQGMIAQYGVLNDDWQLPQATFWAIDGRWYRQSCQDGSSTNERSSHLNLIKKADRMDGLLIALPEFEPYLLGLAIKANSVLIIWHDDKYAQACGKQNQDEILVKTQLQNLAERLHTWGVMVNAP